MASNAKFEIEIYGNTAKFENSLKGINTAMSGLKGEASALKKALQLDPTNTDKMAQLQKNLQQQLTISKNKATQLKQEIADVDKTTPDGQKKWLKLTRDLANTTIQADKLESDIKDVDKAIKNGKWETKAKIDMDTSGVDNGMESIKKKFSGLKSIASTAFNGVKEVAIGALREVGSKITNLITSSLGGAVARFDVLQNYPKIMKQMGYSTDDTAKSIDILKKGVDGLPTKLQDLTQSAQSFAILQKSATKGAETATALNDAFLASGASAADASRGVEQYSQMLASGTVDLTSWRTLQETMPYALTTVAKSFGITGKSAERDLFEKLKSGDITMDQLNDRFVELDKSAGGFATTARTASGGIQTSFNNLENSVTNGLANTLTEVNSAIEDATGKGIAQHLDSLKVVVSDTFKSVNQFIKETIKYIVNLFNALQKNGALTSFSKAWDSIKSMFSSVISIIGNVINSLLGINTETAKNATSFESVSKVISVFADKLSEVASNIANFMKKISESETAMAVLKGTLVVLASAFAAFKVSKGILQTVQAFKDIKKATSLLFGPIKSLFALILTNPFVAIAVAIAAVVAGLVYFFTQTKTGKKMWADFVDFLKSSWDSVVSFFSGIGQWFADLWNGTVNGAKDIWQGLVDWFNSIVQGIQNSWNSMTTFFTNLWATITGGITTAWQGVTEFFTGLFTGIQNIVTTVFTAISTAVTTAYNWFVTTFQPLISFYQSIFNLIGSIVNLAFQLILAVIRGAYQLVLNAWEGLSAWFSGIFDAVSGIAQTVFNAIGNFAKSAWGVVTNIWNAVASFFGGIFDAVAKVVANAFNQVVSWAQSAWNRIVGIWNAISGFFSGIFNSVSSTVSGAFNQVAGFAQNAWGRITGIFGGIGNWFGGIFNSVRNIVSSVFDAFGSWASNAYNSITGVFNGIANWFGGIFQGVSDAIDSALGWVTDTINGISGALDGISNAVSGLFKGSLVTELSGVNFGNLGGGISQNSASADDNRIYNTFNIHGGSNQNVTELARAIRQEFNAGRA
ncbi:MAG: tape measure protein [Lactococcus lactis]